VGGRVEKQCARAGCRSRSATAQCSRSTRCSDQGTAVPRYAAAFTRNGAGRTWRPWNARGVPPAASSGRPGQVRWGDARNKHAAAGRVATKRLKLINMLTHSSRTEHAFYAPPDLVAPWREGGCPARYDRARA
jgi:hypothetical protein